MGDAELPGESSRTPMCRTVGRLLSGFGKNPGLQLRCQHLGLRALMASVQSGDALGLKSALPDGDKPIVAAELAFDLRIGPAVSQQENQSSSASIIGPSASTPGNAEQLR